jgi:hypothetical protein
MKQVLALSLAVAVALAGCVSDDESVPPVPPSSATFKALFVPAGGVFPFPNDLFFSGSADGTVNIPVQDPTDVSDYLVAINALDGFSTTAPIVVPFNAAIDAATITAATVRMVNVTNPAAPVPLTFGTHFTAAVSAAVDGTNQLMITPVAPLVAKGRYAIIVTRGVQSGGVGAIADDSMQLLLDIHTSGSPPPAQLATLYGAIDPALDLANALGVTDANIAVVATFATQSTSDVMQQVATAVTAAPAPQAIPGNGGSFLTFVDTNKVLLDPGNANPGIVSVADIYAGFISIPYYQSRTNILGGRWLTGTGAEVTRYTAAGAVLPAVTETLRFPILVSVPNAGSSCGAKPVAGWPVVLFQHGITQNRTNLIPLAQAAAGDGTPVGPCFAIVAVDHALHGLPTGHPLHASVFSTAFGTTIHEPTFGADVSNNATRAPGADGTPDASGQNYINLSSLLTSRDNLRQSVVNLVRTVKTIPSLDYTGDLAGDFDGSRIHFTGHSLGAIVGTTFLGVDANTQAATLAMPGGTIARLLRDSPTFSVSINNGLAANGVVAGTQLYEQFMQAAQTVVDSGDPINFAAAANAGHAIHLIQVVGTSAATQDQVVPNSATARLIAALGLAKRTAAGVNAPDGYVNFTAGNHSSFLDPTASVPALIEMQTQFANFMGSNGAAIVITNTAVIEP